MRFFAFLEYTAVIVGVIGMIASKFFYLPKGFDLGLFLVGAGFALAGLESLFTQRMSFRFASHAGEGYAGAPALIWAGMALLIGAAFIASAYLMEEGLWRTTVNGLMRRPAPLLAAGGLIAAGAGALLMVNPRQHGIWWTLFVRVPKTLLGLLLIAAVSPPSASACGNGSSRRRSTVFRRRRGSSSTCGRSSGSGEA